MNCNTTHYRANSSSVPGDPTDFDNDFAVYLHDTPAKAAFERDRRAISHGCVRLERAVDLARMVLGNDANPAAGQIDAIIASRETTPVKLSKPVPVRLFYLTAFPADGRIAFRPDVYGWDRDLLAKLDGAKPRSTPAG